MNSEHTFPLINSYSTYLNHNPLDHETLEDEDGLEDPV